MIRKKLGQRIKEKRLQLGLSKKNLLFLLIWTEHILLALKKEKEIFLF
mgnify:CR=1 FL=1